ncbi:MAG: helix-turn-helix domain-containing protein, partial [Alphaproteobacteria bacterium]
TQSISWLQSHFTQPLRIDDLAKKANMGVSTYHQHFRQMTNLSPLQYQKQLRLQEARRLMLTQNIDAATAAYEVGYQSPSQFSREYSRLFDAPPASDIINLRERMTSNLY